MIKMRNFLCFKILFSLFHFLNCAGSGPEWSLNRCQDMASVVGSLINAGCQFNKPDHVNRGLEPKIFMSSDKIEDDRVIKARGLPWQASDHDIARWVYPLSLLSSAISDSIGHTGNSGNFFFANWRISAFLGSFFEPKSAWNQPKPYKIGPEKAISAFSTDCQNEPCNWVPSDVPVFKWICVDYCSFDWHMGTRK